MGKTSYRDYNINDYHYNQYYNAYEYHYYCKQLDSMLSRSLLAVADTGIRVDALVVGRYGSPTVITVSARYSLDCIQQC